MQNSLDMNSISGRYASVRFNAGLSKKAFAESLGIHPVVSGDIELGKRDPSREVLVRLASVYGVDINWLLTGDPAGRTSANLPGEDGPVAYIDFIDQEASAGRGVEIEHNPDVFRLPVLRSFIGPHKPEKVRALEVHGDSMVDIGLNDRDVVFFVPGERRGDGIYVISIGTQLLVKRLQFDPSGSSVQIISENSLYEPRTLSGSDMNQLRIEGRVIGWMHRY
ncbi:helix-turn-helix domain-containing protein [Brucepastera parasyntrophica]|uniref:XRE family transcriptional regulator n=1 Tax=Brucepastera parasyntrophica TaxID=2880008 RepID=UPI00210EF11A|nr:S24 family peptidase [Brucepastera parasyntrophica]ULQ59555.1 helix-turn-helix domain-containing protein [Brucepastera parasyntrophica]